MEQTVLLDQLPQLAQQFWSDVNGATVFAFHGPMGAGKTTIITALCSYKGYVVPESFTHGTSAERMYWFKKGYETGDIKQGDTFNAPSLDPQ